jgi:hypothetical protein
MRMGHHTEYVLPVVHLLIEFVKLAESQALVVFQIPLASAVMITVVVSSSWEINPLGMSELIAHEIKVGLSS